jgi:hypothetical protein
MADADDKTVKELLDAGTRAQLERWFGLPSFEQLADEGKAPAAPEEDPELVEARKRRDAAIAAVDPVLVEAHRGRVEPARPVSRFEAVIDVRVDPDMALFDLTMGTRPLADPREYELPMDLQKNLKDCTPQALLRDLHRAELAFEKKLDYVDPLAELRVDGLGIVAAAMATSWAAPLPGRSAFSEARAILIESRALRRQPWTEIKMPSRGVTE